MGNRRMITMMIALLLLMASAFTMGFISCSDAKIPASTGQHGCLQNNGSDKACCCSGSSDKCCCTESKETCSVDKDKSGACACHITEATASNSNNGLAVERFLTVYSQTYSRTTIVEDTYSKPFLTVISLLSPLNLVSCLRI
jgi:hypothetical protein